MASRDCLWDISRIILWDSIPLKNRPGKACIIFATYSLGSFMIISYYSGEITSFITAKPFLWQPINGFTQLKSSSMKYVVRKGFFEENLFLDDIIMREKMIYVPFDENKTKSYNYGEKPLEMLVDNPRDYVFIASGWRDQINWHYMDMNGQHNFHTSTGSLSFVLIGLFFKKNSLYQNEFNVEMIKMAEGGIFQHFDVLDTHKIKLRLLRRAKDMKRKGYSTDDNQFKIIHMIVGGLIIAYGSILTLVIFCLEYKIPKRRWMEKEN